MSGRAFRLVLASAVMAVCAQTTAQGMAQAAPTPAWHAPTPKQAGGVNTVPLSTKLRPSWTNKREVSGTVPVAWPAAGSATVDLPAPSAGLSASASTAAQRVEATGLPVSVAAAPSASAVHRVRVQMLDRAAAAKAGVSGVVFTVGRADGAAHAGDVSVTVDYSTFAKAYGGDWADRLQLVRLPDGRPLPTTNNVGKGTLTATVPLAATGTVTLAALAAASGDTGSYKATSLSPASTWQVSAQTGSFSWSDPLRVPPAVGGPEPKLALGYSSSSIDGRTAGTNNQGSWIGDGWDMWPGYIERSYRSCADDKDAVGGADPNNKTVTSWDQCWFDDNATISFNGRATELVKGSDGYWHGVSDDGSRIERLTDTGLGNGDADGEYWRVTTTDGTQYYFGRGHGLGGADAGTATWSVWTAPVYGNHPGEPGHAATFADSSTTQAWRWNLDYVVDPHGNTMTYYYQPETGAYGREGDASKRTTYIRGGWLSSIDYGSRSDASSTTQPADRVVFEVADRCTSGCFDSNNKPVAAQWVDTPWDQYCAAAPCTTQLAPSFWTTKRLADIRTQVYSGSGTTFNDVDKVTLRQKYLQAGGNDGSPMWLAGITRTGVAADGTGDNVSDPEIVFDPGADPLPNRVDGPTDGRSDLYRYRIADITTESGEQIAVTYSKPECTRSALPDPATNTKRCFPEWYAPPGEVPTLDWFHKYVVTRVDVGGNLGGSATMQTNYDYLDSPAWHYENSELIPEKKRTWGEWRGYSHVQVRSGVESGTQSATDYLYFRGMDGDKQTSGTRGVSITDSQGTAIVDQNAYAGMLREQTTLNGAGGSWLSGTIDTPSPRGPTATSGPLTAWMVDVGTERSRTRLADGSTRWTRKVTTFNDDGLATQVDDLGDESISVDDLCTRTSYARNATNWMLDKVKSVQTVGVNCSTTATLPRDMVSSSRFTYDAAGNDWNTFLPVKGDAVKSEEIDSWSGTTPTWITAQRAVYDANGRNKEDYDELGRETTTAYTPALTGPVTQKVVTNPLQQALTTTMAASWQLPVTTVDPNGATTQLQYDRKGRLRKVWQPGWSAGAHPDDPNTEFEYLVRNDGAEAVTTTTLLPWGSVGKKKTVTLYDGLMRQRQVQTQAPGGGRTVADTVYDSRGLVDSTTHPYYDTTNAPVDTTLVTTVGTVEPPSMTQNVYDGDGRITDAVFEIAGNEAWRTHTDYGGNSTTVTPPAGGVKTQTVEDARGHTVQRRQFQSYTSTAYDLTTYTYTDAGALASSTDPAGNTWRYGYDQRGNKIRDEDPDKGVTTYTYDAAGKQTSSTDARGVSLFYGYDALARKTSVRDGSATGPLRATWVYDTLTNGIGKLTSSTRYEPAGSANAYTNATVGYDAGGRSTGTTVTIPASQSGLCASKSLNTCAYTFGYTYWLDGTVGQTALPGAADQAAETVYQTYNDAGLPDNLFSSSQIYAQNVTYDKLGRLTQRALGAVGSRVYETYGYQDSTGELVTEGAIPELKNDIFDYTYSYDNAGNLTGIADRPNGGQTPDTQCFGYDYLTRLTAAWTPSSGDCQTAPTVAGLGGPAPYWNSYTYDLTGNRRTDTSHAATDTVRTYTYPASGGAAGSQPHAVQSISETTGTSSKTFQYAYDPTGDDKCRPSGTTADTCASGTAAQTLGWDDEGHLASSVDSTGTTGYLYDADGNRLIGTDPTGKTLYLPGMEVRAANSGTTTATRYYTHAGATVAVRTAGALTWLADDYQGTGEATVNSSTLAVNRRRTNAFGGVRGTAPTTWVGDKGFVGGITDNTGLTHLGAREYDPGIGRFISVDPVHDEDDPQSWNNYAYAGNNPATHSDPSGLCVTDACISHQLNLGDDRDKPAKPRTSNGCPFPVLSCHGGSGHHTSNGGSSGYGLHLFGGPAVHHCLSANACEHYRDMTDIKVQVRRGANGEIYSGPTLCEAGVQSACSEAIAQVRMFEGCDSDMFCFVSYPRPPVPHKSKPNWWDRHGNTVIMAIGGAATITCIIASAGVCAIAVGVATGASIGNRVYNYVKAPKTGKNTTCLVTGIAMDISTAALPAARGGKMWEFTGPISTRRANVLELGYASEAVPCM